MRSEVILNTVSEYFDIPVEVFTNKCNRVEVIMAKHIAVYFHRTRTNMLTADIGRVFNYKDHSATIHAYKMVFKHMSKDFDYCYYVERIEKILKEHDIKSDQFYYDNFQENDFYTNEEINNTNIVVCS